MSLNLAAAIATMSVAEKNYATRQVQRRICPRCGADTLIGIDADRAGLPVVADVKPLDKFGELAAVFNRRSTYWLMPAGRNLVLEFRQPEAIVAQPAEVDSYYPVLAEHPRVCTAT